MVYQRGGGRERCVGCGFGKGQFQVQYDDDCDGSGRGYCSLDCYTSAKVTGRNWQTHVRGRGVDGGGMLYNQQYRRGAGGGGGGGSRGHGGGGPKPWPTGLLVDAPPSPKPWRGRTLSQENMSWRTASTGNLSVTDDSSSQESSVADWHGADSEDGETSVGSGNGSAGDTAPAAAPAPAVLPSQQQQQQLEPPRNNNDNVGNPRCNGDGNGGGAVSWNGGSGGRVVLPREGGNRNNGEAVHHHHGRGQMDHRLGEGDRVNGNGNGKGNGDRGGRGFVAMGQPAAAVAGATRGEATTRRPPLVPLVPIPVVPLAPIPRLQAFPAPRRVHGTFGPGADGDGDGGGGGSGNGGGSGGRGSGGGRRVPVRTVAFASPPAQASPPPRPPGFGRGGQGPLCGPKVETRGAGDVDDGRRVVPPRVRPSAEGESLASGEESETSTTGVGVEGHGTAAAKTSSGGSIAGGGGGSTCGGGTPARRSSSAVSTKVAVRQWRRLFLP
eukprot:g15078.t1